MLSKEELLNKDISELENIANELGAEYKKSDDKESIIYAILDRQAVDAGATHPLGTTKRKRTRIARKETDRVYSVRGKEGENFDVQKNKPTGTTQPALFKDLPDNQGLPHKTRTAIATPKDRQPTGDHKPRTDGTGTTKGRQTAKQTARRDL